MRKEGIIYRVLFFIANSHPHTLLGLVEGGRRGECIEVLLGYKCPLPPPPNMISVSRLEKQISKQR